MVFRPYDRRWMYGMVNRAVRDMVVARFGTEAWTQIHSKAAAPPDFEKMQPYDDGVTYKGRNHIGAKRCKSAASARAVL